MLGAIFLTRFCFGQPIQGTNHEKDMLDEWIEKLGQCESCNNNPSIHYNDGKVGSHSYGEFQWKVATADIWVPKVGLLDNWDKLEYSDKANWLLDKEFAYQLTRKTLEISRYNSSLWVNCTKKLGLPPAYTGEWLSQG